MVCPYRVAVALITGLAVLYIAAREFLFDKSEDENQNLKKKKYSWWDYYTGKWAFDLIRGNQYEQEEQETEKDAAASSGKDTIAASN
jgi:hypothetical protein